MANNIILNDTDDRALIYYAVVDEAVGAENADIQIISDGTKNGLNYLRFSACLQAFNRRNRNRRLWIDKWVRMMIEMENVLELLRNGTMVGENGHPVPATGEATSTRIVTIDPNNVSHRITSFDWRDGGNLLYGMVETLDDGQGGPGYKFMRHILQGLIPSFSLRSIVPQRRNADGSIDVVGCGRLVTYDRVFLPSHPEAYMNVEVPIENIHKESDIKVVMESFGLDLMNHSEKVKQILGNMEPVMESMMIDPHHATISVKNEIGDRLIIAPEMKYRNAIVDLFGNM